MDDPKPVHAAVRTLIDQLARQVPVLAQTIFEQLEFRGLLSHPQNLSQYSCLAIWEFLKNTNLDSAIDERIYWVIDGLDELPIQERFDLFAIITDALRQFRKLSIMVLSRVEEDIVKELDRLQTCCIPVAPEKTENDLRAYIEHAIEAWGFLGSLEVRDLAFEILAKKANGVFLWVKLVMNELTDVVDLDQIEEVLTGFPEDMKQVYNRILTNLFSRHTERHAQLVRTLLKWVLLSQKTLTLSELAVALSPLGSYTADSLKASFIRICGPLLELRDSYQHASSATSQLRPPALSTVHLIHASLADYLCLSKDPSCICSVDETTGHQEIASFCIEYFRNAIQRPLFYPANEATLYKMGHFTLGKLSQLWSSRGPTPIDFDSPTEESSDQYYIHPFVRNKYPLLGYAQQYLFRHVHLSARTKPLSASLIDKLLSVSTFGSTLHILKSIRISMPASLPEALTDEIIALFAKIPSNDGWEFEYLKASLWSGVSGRENQWPQWQIQQAIDNGIGNNHPGGEQDPAQSSQSFFLRAINLEKLGDFESAFCSCLLAFDLDESLKDILDIPGKSSSFSLLEAHLGKVLELCSPIQLLVLGSLLHKAGRSSILITIIKEMDSSNHGPQYLEVKAKLLAASGCFLDAAELYYKASSLDGERWDLKEARFSLLVKARRYKEAAKVLELWRRDDHWCEGAWLCRRKAQLYEAFQIYEQTLVIYMRGVEQYPLCWELYRETSFLLTRHGHSSHAVGILAMARTQPGLGFLAAQELISFYLQAGQNSEASSIAKSLTISHKDRWDSYETLWKILSASQPIEDVDKIFEELTRQPDPRWEPFVYLAYTRLSLGLYDHAISACEAALKIKKHDSAVWTMAKAYISKGDLDKALDILLSGFLEYGPRGVHANLLTNTQLYQSFDVGYYYVAIAYLSRRVENWEPLRWSLLKRKKLTLDPSNFSKMKWTGMNEENLALAEFHMGNLAAAKESCVRSLRDDLEPAKLPFRQALLAIILSRLGQNAEAFQQSISFVTANEPGPQWQRLGRFALGLGDLKLTALCFDVDLQVRNCDIGRTRVDSDDDDAASTVVPRTCHWGILCDGCQGLEFFGFRHECIQCKDFCFCGSCFETLRDSHDTEHDFMKFPSEQYPRLREAEAHRLMGFNS